METKLTPVPTAVTKIGGSMKVTVPPAFFVLTGIDKTQALEADVYLDGGNLVVKIRPIPQPDQP